MWLQPALQSRLLSISQSPSCLISALGDSRTNMLELHRQTEYGNNVCTYLYVCLCLCVCVSVCVCVCDAAAELIRLRRLGQRPTRFRGTNIDRVPLVDLEPGRVPGSPSCIFSPENTEKKKTKKLKKHDASGSGTPHGTEPTRISEL